jgi:capsular exopolysaccharide synthesis family protein
MTRSSKESRPAEKRSSHAAVNEHLVSLVNPASFEAERYWVLRHKVEQMHRNSGLSIIALASPVAGDGKTTTAINLAATLAQPPASRVLLVDLDFRRPAVGKSLRIGHPDGPGLENAILDPDLKLEEVVQDHPSFDLSLLLPGPLHTTPYELLKSSRLGELLQEAKQKYDYVVLDTPPLVLIPDAQVISDWVDGFLIVVAAHKTPRKLLEEALNAMGPDKIVGLVFNGDDRPLYGYYRYYYTYFQPA